MPDIFTSPPQPSLPTALSGGSSGIMKSLSSYLFMPADIRFETQDPGETIILLLRKHLITNIPWIFTGILLIVVPLFLFPFILINNILPDFLPQTFIIFLILTWYLLTFSFLIVNFILWYFTVSIVTNERIVDIDLINLLHKKFAETRLSKVEDVTMRRGGFIRSVFDFGNVVVQTAAHEQVFIFDDVPKPTDVVRIINQLVENIEESPPQI